MVEPLDAYDYAGWQTYVNDRYGYTVQVPANMAIEESLDKTSVDFKGPIVDDVRTFTDKIARDPRQLGLKGMVVVELTAREGWAAAQGRAAVVVLKTEISDEDLEAIAAYLAPRD